MINEILTKYNTFTDALILGFNYKASFVDKNKGQIEVLAKCMNGKESGQWEIIKLQFNDVVSFRFIEKKVSSSAIIDSALLRQDGAIITLDFFPLFGAGGVMQEDEASDMVIKCRQLNYELISKLY